MRGDTISASRACKFLATLCWRIISTGSLALPNCRRSFRVSKSYIARQIIDLLERNSADVLLRQLQTHKLEHKVESDYQVWQEGSKPKQIQNDEMLWQKLEYTHNNPVERGYIDDPLHWRYSSARNYARQPGLIDVVTDWM